MFHGYMQRRIEDNTIQKSREVANGTLYILDAIAGNLSILLHTLVQTKELEMASLVDSFLASNSEFLGFAAYTKRDGKLAPIIARPRRGSDDPRFMGKDQSGVIEQALAKLPVLLASRSTQMSVFDLTTDTGLPLIAVASRFDIQIAGRQIGAKDQVWAVLVIWQTRLARTLPVEARTRASLVDLAGRTLVSPKRVKHSQDLIRRASKGGEPYGFQESKDENAQSWLGAFAVIPRYGLIAVVESDGRETLEVTKWVVVRSALWALLFVLISLGVSFLVSSGITLNLRRVTAVTEKIARGEFVTVPSVSRDEIGILATAVNNMSGKIARLMQQEVAKAHLERELEMAAMIQHTFLPRIAAPSSGDRLALACSYSPASQCCGDWYGHFPISEHEHFVFIADATGHGVPAAMVTAIAFSGVSLMIAERDAKLPPFEFLKSTIERLNAMMCAAGEGSLTMTMLAVHVNLATGLMTYVNAGHIFPVVIPYIPPATTPPEPQAKPVKTFYHLTAPSSILGFSGNSSFKGAAITLNPMDKVLLYTDGLTDIVNHAGKRWGSNALNRVLRSHAVGSADVLKDHIIATAFQHRESIALPDDVTLLVLEIVADELVSIDLAS